MIDQFGIPGTILLSGVVGSTAYGMAGPESDVDRLGIYAAPTSRFLGLHLPTKSDLTTVFTNPDATFHEAGKFALLCLGGNPTLNELLWLDEYEVKTGFGVELVRIRSAFLSAKRIRDSYLGYVTQQIKRLDNTGEFQSKYGKRTAKHGRHILRLLQQGFELYSTGKITVRVNNADWLRQQGEEIAAEPAYALQFLHEYEEKFNNTPSALPDYPDEAAVDRWMRAVRNWFFVPPR